MDINGYIQDLRVSNARETRYLPHRDTMYGNLDRNAIPEELLPISVSERGYAVLLGSHIAPPSVFSEGRIHLDAIRWATTPLSIQTGAVPMLMDGTFAVTSALDPLGIPEFPEFGLDFSDLSLGAAALVRQAEIRALVEERGSKITPVNFIDWANEDGHRHSALYLDAPTNTTQWSPLDNGPYLLISVLAVSGLEIEKYHGPIFSGSYQIARTTYTQDERLIKNQMVPPESCWRDFLMGGSLADSFIVQGPYVAGSFEPPHACFSGGQGLRQWNAIWPSDGQSFLELPRAPTTHSHDWNGQSHAGFRFQFSGKTNYWMLHNPEPRSDVPEAQCCASHGTGAFAVQIVQNDPGPWHYRILYSGCATAGQGLITGEAPLEPTEVRVVSPDITGTGIYPLLESGLAYTNNAPPPPAGCVT